MLITAGVIYDVFVKKKKILNKTTGRIKQQPFSETRLLAEIKSLILASFKD